MDTNDNLRNSAEVEPFVCETCFKAFSHKHELITHAESHVDVKPFVCEICNKAFKQKGHLRRHRYTHTAEERFVCEVCNASFLHEGKRDVNRTIHSREKATANKLTKPRDGKAQHLRYQSQSHALQSQIHQADVFELPGLTNVDEKSRAAAIVQSKPHQVALPRWDHIVYESSDANSQQTPVLIELNENIQQETTVKEQVIPQELLNLSPQSAVSVVTSANNREVEQTLLEEVGLQEVAALMTNDHLATNDSEHGSLHAVQRQLNVTTKRAINAKGTIKNKTDKTIVIRAKRQKVKKSFVCEACGNVYSSKWSLNAHLQYHITEEHFTCNLCNEAFKRKGRLSAHMYKHYSVTNFVCQVCNTQAGNP